MGSPQSDSSTLAALAPTTGKMPAVSLTGSFREMSPNDAFSAMALRLGQINNEKRFGDKNPIAMQAMGRTPAAKGGSQQGTTATAATPQASRAVYENVGSPKPWALR